MMRTLLALLLLSATTPANAGRVTGIRITPTPSATSTSVDIDVTLFTTGAYAQGAWVLGDAIDGTGNNTTYTFANYGFGFGGTTYTIGNYYRSDWNTTGAAALSFGDGQSAQRIVLDEDGTTSSGRTAYRGTFTHTYAPGSYTAEVRVGPTGTLNEPGHGPATFFNPAASPSYGVARTGDLINRYVNVYGVFKGSLVMTTGTFSDTFFYTDTVISISQSAAFTVTAPPNASCGDGTVDADEECDDGNRLNDDGCDSNCLDECGNGQLDGDEECDDGNQRDGDGCDARCISECGNGRIDGRETCDDGNRLNDDGCDSQCALECGNGRIDGRETCDDGNTVNFDGCDAFCDLECGNGYIEGNETCDDGNNLDGDGCSSSCFEEFGARDTATPLPPERGCACSVRYPAPSLSVSLLTLLWVGRRRRRATSTTSGETKPVA